MLDVARRAGVSKATVSHVINETRFVEEETRQRVLRAIADLGYSPNAAARSLTTKRTGTIGVLISDASNAFFGEVLLGVEDVFQPENCGLIVCNTDEILERESHCLELLFRQRVDGIIAAATSQRWSALGEAELRHTPIVFLDRRFDEMGGPYVGVDNEGGAHLAVRHLLDCGYRQIGVLAGFQRLSTMRERLAGYRRALAEAGLAPVEEWIITSPLSIEAGQEAAHTILSLAERPRALFVANNLLVLGALRALKERGQRCPEDVALVVFDDHPWAVVSAPPLTAVRQPSRRLGQIAAQMLSQLIDDQPIEETNVILGCELIVRQSC